MTVNEWAAREHFTVVTGTASLDRSIDGGYCGDLLSWVMGRAPADTAWITVMGNVNAIAVAVLADIACLVLCEGATLDEEARRKAQEQDVAVLATRQTAFEVAARLAAQL